VGAYDWLAFFFLGPFDGVGILVAAIFLTTTLTSSMPRVRSGFVRLRQKAIPDRPLLGFPLQGPLNF